MKRPSKESRQSDISSTTTTAATKCSLPVKVSCWQSNVCGKLGLCTMSAMSYHEALYWGSFILLGSLLLVTSFVGLPVLLQMVLYTFPLLYIGSHLSLQQNEIDPVTGDKPMKAESMTHKDAMLFPFIGSAVLMSLYLAYRLFPPYWVNLMVTLYLVLFGCVSVGETLYLIAERVLPAVCQKELINVHITLPASLEEKLGPIVIVGTGSHVVSYAIGMSLGAVWFFAKGWVIHNLFALSFCIQAIRIISVGNFKIACVLLLGLFLYDIFWVFGTDVMVAVAKSIDGPVKIIFPISHKPWSQSILGLGDVVLPGALIAMILRFDHHLASSMAAKRTDSPLTEIINPIGDKFDIHQCFPKLYFWINMAAYEGGLITTGVVMLVFKHAQPALLYLVPFCLAGLFIPAYLFGEINKVLEYTEEEEEKKDISDEGKKEGDDGTELKNGKGD